MDSKIKAVSFGEVLWDVFGTEKKIGGAPLNLALRMQSLGCDAAMISAIGNDHDGQNIIDYVQGKGLDTAGIVTVEGYPTGLVQVHLNEHGSASYDISYPSAWDKIALNKSARNLAESAHVIIYGSLACRDLVSQQALAELLQYNTFKVFDVNLRKPHYSLETLKTLMQPADFIKFNDDELLEIAAALGSTSDSLEENIHYVYKWLNKADVKGICVTRGAHGALLFWEGQLYDNGGYKVTVADTVGAGDSFLATLIMKLLSGLPPHKALDYACAMGALVAASPGANPHIEDTQVENLIANGQ
ncbi:carbohydrate kinase [Flavobacterium akiainvivens]|uniref:Carbohydrate kinase n=1 Tax=Flavobacterium akiainvivens TaxID=1202724 RepID=A0A0M8MA14_9FLAO|nr:carbohydrate kinase [Flavobacterium akiainvivens]KOS05695.1 carbohydrate kinase [Flavobacterium akiainvivens]SFQ36811.1 fructokinase [Flavobacterium akiainvivens]